MMLSSNFYRMPGSYTETMTRADLKDVLLNLPSGRVFARGEAWSIRSKHLGAGVYRVWLEPARAAQETQ